MPKNKAYSICHDSEIERNQKFMSKFLFIIVVASYTILESKAKIHYKYIPLIFYSSIIPQGAFTMINCCYIVTTSSSALLRSFFLLSSVRWCLHRCTNWTSLLLKTLSIPNSYMSKGHFKSSVNSQKKRSADTLSVLGGGTHSPTPPAKTAEKKQHL